MLLLAVLLLTAAAWLRGAEYDEQYTLFLTAGTARPDWPDTAFLVGTIAAQQTGHASLAGIALDLRATDVHPPVYFWALSPWREVFGPGLFAARMLSVLCGLVSLCLVATIARRSAIPPALAMLLTLGCYGFIYTNAIARGFAAANMLTLCGIAMLLGRRPLLAGACLGAACCCNYLTVFVAAAAIAVAGAWAAVPAAVPFLALDAWFFAAQHAARPGQFPPFEIWPSLLRLAEFQTAAVFGGLPLYVDGPWRIVVGTLIGSLAAGVVFCVCRGRPWRGKRALKIILAASVAAPIGLLLLGAAFDNTPIELRYLSSGLPFIGLLIAWACRSPFDRLRGDFRSRRGSMIAIAFLPLTLAIQSAGVAGLLMSPHTMQPARAAATETARLAGDGLVLLPRGNDGVGIVGAFGIEAPPSLHVLLVRPFDSVLDRIAPYRRVVIAMLAQDHDSIATIAMLRATLVPPNWRRVAIGSNVEVYERTAEGK